MTQAPLLFLLTTLTVPASAALEAGLPTGVCSEDFCGPFQEEIWNRFQTFSGIDHERSPGVYAGVCFHNTPSLNGDRVHYGAILIEKTKDGLFFDGRFSFFTENNPYADLSAEDARERFDGLFDPTHELDLNPTFAFVNLEDRFVSRRYWFRQDGNKNRLALVGYFGPLHTILCDLRRNL
jgi:hypothetical protein